MKIRLANADDHKGIVNILNETARDLHNKGITQWDFPWDENEVMNQIRSRNLYIVLVDEQVVSG